jgi:hypothetical protein
MIFGFRQELEDSRRWPLAFIMAWAEPGVEPDTGAPSAARDQLRVFHGELYRCFTARADALSELCDGAPPGAVVPDGGERPSIALPS